MTKRFYCGDTEGDGLLQDITKLHCASFTELSPSMKTVRHFSLVDTGKICDMFADPDNILVMHNIADYDVPVIEKLYGTEVKAEVVDTLFLSWYLYPKRKAHGLESWGEDFGVLKPEVEDWVGQDVAVYLNRCQEDTKIQTLLWKQMWNDLMALYGNSAGCWHVIRHLNFKARCAALQTKAKWKLNVDECVKADEGFGVKIVEAKAKLEEGMPQVPVYKTSKYPAKPFLKNGGLSKTGNNWIAKVLEHVDPELYGHTENETDLLA